MRKFIISGCLVVAVLALVASKSSAQIVAWDVQGHGSPFDTTLAASSTAANLASTPSLSRVGLTGSSAGNSFSSSAWNFSSTVLATNTDYDTFTVTAAAGHLLNLTSLDYAMNGSNTAPGTDQWGFSTDGGSTWTMEPAFNMAFAQPSGTVNWNFADVSATSVEFRFWAYGTTSINGGTAASTGTTRINNVTGNDLVLNGTVTLVPEPSTLSLIGLGLLGMVAFSRRRSIRQ